MSYRNAVVSLTTLSIAVATGGVLAQGVIDDALMQATIPDLQPMAEHADQQIYLDLVSQGLATEAFDLAFEEGDELFETSFNAADGVGANVGDGQRFTRVPRADLLGSGEWAAHEPMRSTGPNAQACSSCHNEPFDDGAGLATNNVHRDPLHTGMPGSFITRNAPHLFGIGAIQQLAEEMSTELQGQRQAAINASCSSDTDIEQELNAKGVPFGRLVVRLLDAADSCRFELDTAGVEGVNADLVIRPFHWKGRDATLRQFNRDASHNELGMQPVELVGEGIDGDGDGSIDELTVGDMTAMVIYLAGQPRPISLEELDAIGQIPPLEAAQRESIAIGRRVFSEVGCAGCHTPELSLTDTVFREPSSHPDFRDDAFAGNVPPTMVGVDPMNPVSFDLGADLPDNHIENDDGTVLQLGNFQQADDGSARVMLYSDLKRHEMGPALAESIDETGVGASVWLTRSLWGVGSTAPYLHDGRATTIGEAIVAHGGEAEDSRLRYEALSDLDKLSIVDFLKSLVLFKTEEEEEEETADAGAPTDLSVAE